ncbi:MAG: hypothetical protein PUD93_04235 [Lachnospiraceae bacterium]|nr:hypothetical protein [Lachnospiraceae bacterium]
MRAAKEKFLILRDIIYKGFCIILLLLFFYVILQKGYTILTYDTPKELREMNTVVFAYNFAYGKNLYSVSTLGNEVPAATSIYGFLVPLLMSPFIRLFAFSTLNALQICELLTFIVEITGAFFFYRFLFRKTKSLLLAIVGMLLFYSCYWRYSAFGGAFPDQWGITLSIILMDRLQVDKQKHRYHPMLYAALIISLFYIKQYFVLTAIGLCIYLFLHSRKDWQKFIVYGMLMGSISVLFVSVAFPLYFSETFPIAQGQTLTGSPDYSLQQIKKLSLYYGYIIVFAILRISMEIYTMIKKKCVLKEISYELCQIIFILPILFRIAENQGTNYTYYLQLWYPYIIAYSIVSISKVTESLKQLPDSKKFFGIYSAITCLFLALSVKNIMPSFSCTFMTKEQQNAWDNAYAILERYSSEGEILVSMHLSGFCLENNIPTTSYGQAEYNSVENLMKYKNNKIWRNIFLFDYAKEILQNNISYSETVKENIYNHKYYCIALVYAGEYGLSEADLINAGYHIMTSEELMTGSQCWNTNFYVYE